MKLKSIAMLALAAAITLSSCSKSDDDLGKQPEKEKPISPNIKETYWLDLNSVDDKEWLVGQPFYMLYFETNGSFRFVADPSETGGGEGYYIKKRQQLYVLSKQCRL